MTDYETITRTCIAERKKAATDKLCRAFAAVIVGGFWILVVALCVVEWTR